MLAHFFDFRAFHHGKWCGRSEPAVSMLAKPLRENRRRKKPGAVPSPLPADLFRSAIVSENTVKPSKSQKHFDKDSVTDAELAREAQTLSPANLAGGFGLRAISSDWQRERALTIHRICEHIRALVAKGQSLNKGCRLFSKRWSGKPFRSDPTRHYALNVSSLYRHYRRWRLGGEVPSAVQLRFRPTNRRIPAAVLVRFIELCANQEFPSFRAAGETFCRRGGNYGPGRARGRKLKLGYHSLRWNLPKGCFAQFKRCWKVIRQAQRQIQILRLKNTAEIRAHVPDHLPRRRVKREGDFEI